MIGAIQRYFTWLHLGFPAGKPDRVPEVGPEGEVGIPGVRLAGSLSGNPLLKFAAHSGTRAIAAFARELANRSGSGTPATEPSSVAVQGAPSGVSQADSVLDVAILGGGVSGVSAALEAKRLGLRYQVIEAASLFSTIQRFPKKKPIFRLPAGWNSGAALRIEGESREALLESLSSQAREGEISWRQARVLGLSRARSQGGEPVFEITLAEGADQEAAEKGGALLRARRVLLALGRNGAERVLGVAGEKLSQVRTALDDAENYRGKRVVVVGGGDSAVEAAIALARSGAEVRLVHRGASFSRAQPALVQELVRLLPPDAIRLGHRVREIGMGHAVLESAGKKSELPCDFVFTLLGRELPLGFLRDLGVRIRGDRGARFWLSFVLTLVAVLAVFSWKSPYGEVYRFFAEKKFFPFGFAPGTQEGASGAPALGPWVSLLGQPGFWYEVTYTLLIAIFGVRRVLRNPTPYVKKQTAVLFLVQSLPLFVLPYFLLPALGQSGVFDSGLGKWFADEFFPFDPQGAAREYWRSVGFILAWPLFAWNVFSPDPKWGWLVVSLLQTFVLLPLLVMRYGKGAYCGWICSCGALAETLGDAKRGRMPHGRFWNALNLAGQLILLVAFAIAAIRLTGFFWPETALGARAEELFYQLVFAARVGPVSVSYYTVVDYFLSGVVGIGLFFHFSGRTWCRFFCPLAALMNIYARLGRFRIFSDKSKCISCNACTSQCHMGIDVMSFARRGEPMNDPQCVRCSACVSACPTGTLQFGRFTRDGFVALDQTPANALHLPKNSS